MGFLGHQTETHSAWLLRFCFHFFLGVLIGLFPAVCVLSAITLAPGADVSMIVSMVVLAVCVPCGILFGILGLIGRGRLVYGFLRLLGRDVDRP
jgi:hypothetical protein